MGYVCAADARHHPLTGELERLGGPGRSPFQSTMAPTMPNSCSGLTATVIISSPDLDLVPASEPMASSGM